MPGGPPARSIYAGPSACCCAWSDCPMRRTAPTAPPEPSSGYTPPVFFTGGRVYSTLIALRASKIAVYISVRASPSERRSTPAHLNDTFEIEFECHVERLSASCRGTASRPACEGIPYFDAMLMLCSDRPPLRSLGQAVQGDPSEPPTLSLTSRGLLRWGVADRASNVRVSDMSYQLMINACMLCHLNDFGLLRLHSLFVIRVLALRFCLSACEHP
jgi:hypothetical protein